MGEGLPVRLTVETAEELARRADLSAGAKLLVRAGQTPRELLDLLIQGRHQLDAVRVMAHALPKREAVWWAVGCAKMAYRDSISENEAAAIRAAEAWTLDPTDSNRRAAMAAAEAAGLGTPAGCACASAFFSGGSIAPPGLPEVPPAESVTAQLAAASIAMSGILSEPEKAPEKHDGHLILGRKIIDGTVAPPSPKGTAPAVSPPAATVNPAQPTDANAKRSSLFF